MHSTDPMHSINNVNDRMPNNNPLMSDAAFHPGPILRSPPKPIKHNLQSSQNTKDIDPNINFDFEKNSPFQEGIMSETFQRLDKSFFQEPEELGDPINKRELYPQILTKTMDIDKIPKIIQRKVLKGTPLPIEIKEIQADYLCCPYF